MEVISTYLWVLHLKKFGRVIFNWSKIAVPFHALRGMYFTNPDHELPAPSFMVVCRRIVRLIDWKREANHRQKEYQQELV